MRVDPVACGFFLLLAFTLAGVAQTAWFMSRASRGFAGAVDGGRTLRGRPLFGANKTWRGFVVMVPATAGAFALLATAAPQGSGLWELSVQSYAGLGAVAGLAFMAGELPNSFVKRQLDVAPGAAPDSRIAAAAHFLGDRLDSGLAMLLAISLLVPTPWQTWAVVLLVGPFIHWSFSLVMYRLGLKSRAA